MAWDFNSASDAGGLIPADTPVAARIELRPGFNQKGGEFANATMSRSSGALYADLRLHIVYLLCRAIERADPAPPNQTCQFQDAA